MNNRPDGSRIVRRDYEDGDKVAYEQPRKTAFSVQFFRDGAVAAADRFKLWVESDAGLLAAEGALRDPGANPRWPQPGTQMWVEVPIEVRRLDDIIKDKWEERALIDLVCHYTDTETHDDRAPETVQLTTSVDDVTLVNRELTKP